MIRLQFSEFDIGRVIGSGTVGTVYEVIKHETGEEFALKLLTPKTVSAQTGVISR